MRTLPAARAALAACLVGGWLVLLALGRGFIAASGPAYDEPGHLLSGYSALTRRRPLNWRDHPPLAEAWDALPLLALRPSPVPENAEALPLYAAADLFLHKNAVGASRLLDTARLWSLATWGALLIGVIGAWAFSLGGFTCAAAACALAAFFPPFLSNAALVTTDAAPCALFALLFWLLSRPRRPTRLWGAAGGVLGLALTAKFSMIAAPVILAAVLLAERRLAEEKAARIRQLVVFSACSLAAVVIVYAPWGLSLFPRGLAETLLRVGRGRPAFLAGRHFMHGSIWYFPAVIFLKTPPPTLILALGALAAWARRWNRERLWLVLPPSLYFMLVLASRTQIGYRHVLPVYPFMIVMAAWAAARLWGLNRWGRGAVVGLLCWQAAGTLAVQPHQLSYFSELIGGPARGHEWLVDSNLDWGQDLPALAAKLRSRGNPAIYFSYFGVGDPSFYGIRYLPVAWYTDVGQRGGVFMPGGPRVWLAVSATNLQGVYYRDPSLWSWLKERHPIFDAGHSIFVYDLSQDAEGQGRLRAIVAASGFKPPISLAGGRSR